MGQGQSNVGPSDPSSTVNITAATTNPFLQYPLLLILYLQSTNHTATHRNTANNKRSAQVQIIFAADNTRGAPKPQRTQTQTTNVPKQAIHQRAKQIFLPVSM